MLRCDHHANLVRSLSLQALSHVLDEGILGQFRLVRVVTLLLRIVIQLPNALVLGEDAQHCLQGVRVRDVLEGFWGTDKYQLELGLQLSNQQQHSPFNKRW